MMDARKTKEIPNNPAPRQELNGMHERKARQVSIFEDAALFGGLRLDPAVNAAIKMSYGRPKRRTKMSRLRPGSTITRANCWERKRQ